MREGSPNFWYKSGFELRSELSKAYPEIDLKGVIVTYLGKPES